MKYLACWIVMMLHRYVIKDEPRGERFVVERKPGIVLKGLVEGQRVDGDQIVLSLRLGSTRPGDGLTVDVNVDASYRKVFTTGMKLKARFEEDV